MVQGTCMKLEQMIQQGQIHCNTEGKIILLSGAMIPNYFGKQLYMECIEEWHRLNPGQIVTSRLSSNANPDPDQAAMQQLLIHEVMQQDVAMSQALSKEEWIEALECKLFALRQSGKKFDGAAPLTSNTLATSSPANSTPAPAARPADKDKAPEHTITNKQPPVAKESTTQPPIHPFSGIPSCYAPPANRNFAAPNRSNNGTYQTMPPIYDIEQSKAVFEQVLSTKVTVSVGKLCSVSQNIRNQFRTAVMPKQLVGASANIVQDSSDIFKDILPTFAIKKPQFLHGSNTDTANGLTLEKVPLTSVDPVEAYINLLPHGEEPVVLTVAKDSQLLHSVMMLINNKEEVECIHDSSSQIISMSTEIASDLGLSYDPNIVLNMQSANSTLDRSLGLAGNVLCTIGNITTLPLDTNDTSTTPTYVNIPFPAQFVANKPPKQKGVQIKKKYKPVTMKTKLVTSHISEDFWIERQIIGDPLATIPPLNPNLPPFVPTKQFTSEQQAKLIKDYNTGFLTSDKINVLVDMVTKQEKAFAWEDSK
ncbi:hypothetical protein C0989_003904 [Termitomyces sp. Mn162]|nr:hypothetical protein C0989_003904 [Termitomyces sp. Mn162]